MGIDGITFIAQIINLFVLIWLMKRFLYRPVLAAVEKRRQYILTQVNTADELKKNREKELALAQKERSTFLAQKEALLLKAEQEAQQLLTQAQEQVNQLTSVAEQDLKNRLQNTSAELNQQLALWAGESAFRALLKICADFGITANVEKEIPLLMAALKKLPARQKKAMKAAALKTGQMIVASSHGLSIAQKEEIKAKINQLFQLDDTVRFKFSIQKKLGIGFYIQGGDYMAGWNLKTRFDELLHHFNKHITPL